MVHGGHGLGEATEPPFGHGQQCLAIIMVWVYGEYRLSPIMNCVPLMSGNRVLSLIEELFDSPL